MGARFGNFACLITRRARSLSCSGATGSGIGLVMISRFAPGGDLPLAIGTVPELGGGGGAHAGFGRAVGPPTGPYAFDPVGQVEQLAVGLVVEISPPAGVS